MRNEKSPAPKSAAASTIHPPSRAYTQMAASRFQGRLKLTRSTSLAAALGALLFCGRDLGIDRGLQHESRRIRQHHGGHVLEDHRLLRRAIRARRFGGSRDGRNSGRRGRRPAQEFERVGPVEGYGQVVSLREIAAELRE